MHGFLRRESHEGNDDDESYLGGLEGSSFVEMDFDNFRDNRRMNWYQKLYYCQYKEISIQKIAAIIGVLLATLILLVLGLLIVQILNHENNKSQVTWNNHNHDNHQSKVPDVCLTPTCVQVAAEILSDLNMSADPCEDFYSFACGGWLTKNPLPDDKNRVSRFNSVRHSNLKMLNRLLDQPFSKDDKTGNGTIVSILKAMSYYHSCMNTDIAEKLGAKEPMSHFFDDHIGGNATLEDILASLHIADVATLFQIKVGNDERNASINTVYIDQVGLSLPDYASYEDTEKAVKYEDHISKMFTLVGVVDDTETAKEMASNVVSFEKRLASHFSEIVMDPTTSYNPYNMTQMNELTSFQIRWPTYFSYVFPVTEVTRAIVRNPEYMRGLGQALQEYGVEVFKTFCKWQSITKFKRQLNRVVEKEAERWHYYISGAHHFSSRWSMCVADTDKQFGLAVGRLFVENTFSGSDMASAKSILKTVVSQFQESLKEIDWMDYPTRLLAQHKSRKLSKKIGYPNIIFNDTMLDEHYAHLNVFSCMSYMCHALAARRFHCNRQFSKLSMADGFDLAGGEEWDLSPASVNAFYNPSKNEIIFPAGILQPPFFSNSYPKSLNFGGFGMFSGHELVHSFDDQGRMYNAEGELDSWWTNETEANYHNTTQCFAKQYSKYSIKDVDGNDIFLNGNKTIAENAADTGGLVQAYLAYQNWKLRNGNETDLPGLNLNHDQLFFVNFARSFCAASNPISAASHLRTDIHSPSKFRVSGALKNTKIFSDAFTCSPTSKLYFDENSDNCNFW